MAKAALPKTNLHSIFHTDNKLEEEGAWVEINTFYGLSIKVRRLNSDAALKAFNRIVAERYGDGQLQKPQDLEPEQLEEVFIYQLAEAVLIDWKGLRDEDGADIPYSVEMAVELLKMRDFREFVAQAAKERDAFRGKDDEEAAKNS